MGLFGKKKPKLIKTTFGKLPDVKCEADLPDDLDTLIRLAQYFAIRKKDPEMAFYCDRRICQLDSGMTYAEARRRMAECYFRGFMVPRDVAKGEELFLQYMEAAITIYDVASVASAIVSYYKWGFCNIERLLPMAEKRIAADAKNGQPPFGLWLYDQLSLLHASAELINILGVSGHPTVYLRNFGGMGVCDAARYMALRLDDKMDRETLEQLAREGNIFAIGWLLNITPPYAENPSEKAKRAEYEKLMADAYARIRQNADYYTVERAGQRRDERKRQLLACRDFLQGRAEELPANYPLRKDADSLYGLMKGMKESYAVLCAAWAKDPSSLRGTAYDASKETFTRCAKKLSSRGWPLADYLMLLSAANKIVPDILGGGSMKGIYDRLCQKEYQPALDLQQQVTAETRQLAFLLRCNPQLVLEKQQEIVNRCTKACKEQEWYAAFDALIEAACWDCEAALEDKKALVIRSALRLERHQIPIESSTLRTRYEQAARYFNEPIAHLYMASYENDRRRNFTLAREHALKAMEYAHKSYLTYGGYIGDSQMEHLKESLAVIEKNIEVERQRGRY
ncbi:MAG: hypothetical protein IJP03_05125 [Christensenellaceae bacterium]|nr:hypothetical protein [Christensenellaceae bacterium]